MGGKLSKKKGCDLPNPEVAIGIQEPEDKIEHEVQNVQQDEECNTANVSTKEKLLAEKTVYQKKEPEASKDENQIAKHQEDVKDTMSSSNGKTEAVIEVGTNKIVQQFEEPALKTMEPSDQSTDKQMEPLQEKSTFQMEEDFSKSDLPLKCESKLSANVLELTKEIELKTTPADLDAIPDTDTQNQMLNVQMEEDSNKLDLPLKCESKLSANVLELTKEIELKTTPADLDAIPDTDTQNLMLDVHKINKDETACEYTMGVSNVDSEQVKQGNVYHETNNGEHGSDLTLVEKCGKTDTINSQQHVSSTSLQLEKGSNHDTQEIELKTSNENVVEHEKISVALDLEVRLQDIENQESMTDQHASLVVQQIPMRKQNTNLEQVEQETNHSIVAEEQLMGKSDGSPEAAGQTWTSAENITLEGSLALPQQPGNGTQVNLLTQVKQMEQESYVEECMAESNRAIVPGTD
uniref:Uncharacterized protein LOC117358725 n=1 Tax=Geotrypetes seraphini TaxID=260995 RepID=A0A6P8R7N2_GEOSA|nr:uncharacterized protein LOC117358725 [Geotrypetes seraphini]